MKLLKDVLTGKDNQTYDIGRFLLLIGSISFLIMQACDVTLLHHTFNAIGFGTGFGGLLAGGSGGLALKHMTEPVIDDTGDK